MILSKIDLTKEDPNYYQASKKPEIRDLDSYYYLTFQGKSAPEDPLFLNAIESLYAVAYDLKFLCKAEDNDFVMPKMEGFWWIDGGPESQKHFATTPRSEWNWKIMIRMPDFVEAGHFFRASEGAKRKKSQNKLISEVKYELINEGLCAQILHIGSYEEEEETIQTLHAYITENGYEIANYHHEIYISDPRKTAEENLKTIIRYGIK